MRVAALLAVLAVGCGGKRDDDRKPGRSGKHAHKSTVITYELETRDLLDGAVRDLAGKIHERLARDNVDARIGVDPAGNVTIRPDEKPLARQIREAANAVAGDRLASRDCPDAEPDGTICLKPASTLARDTQKDALREAAATMRRRLDARDANDVTVAIDGEHLVVEMADLDDDEMATLRNILSRRGRLELVVVDNNAPFMQHVYLRAHPDRDGTVTDPTAEHGLRAEIDFWRPESGGPQNDIYLVGYDGGHALGQLGQEAIRRYLHDLAAVSSEYVVPDDRRILFERVTPPPDAKDRRPYARSYYVEAMPRLTGASIANAKAIDDPNTNRRIVMLEFDDAGARVFGDLTASIVGKKLATVLDGRIVSAPIINAAIRGGRAAITMGGSDRARQERDADELVTILKAGALPAPLREARIEQR